MQSLNCKKKWLKRRLTDKSRRNGLDAEAKAKLDAARTEYDTFQSTQALQQKQIGEQASQAAQFAWQSSMQAQTQLQQAGAALSKATYIADYCVRTKNPGMAGQVRAEACTEPSSPRDAVPRAAACEDETRWNSRTTIAPGTSRVAH